MKKFIAIGLIIASLFLMSGCGEASASLFSTSNWLVNTTDKGVEEVNEITTYKVSLTPNDDGNDTLSMSIDSNSSYKTSLTNTKYDAFLDEKDGEEYKTENLDCYLFETELQISGSFKIDNTETLFDDSILTKCYFLGIKDNLQPLYSERIVKTHSPVLKDSTYSIEYFDYSLKTIYPLSSDGYGNTAEVTFKKGDANKGEIALDEGTQRYDKIRANSKSYIDNEILLLCPRATSLNELSTIEINTIDTICNINRKLNISNSASGSNVLDLTANANRYTFDGLREDEAVCTILNFEIDSDFPGKPITAYYANPSSLNSKRLRGSLLKIETQALYNMGTIVYTANKTTTK